MTFIQCVPIVISLLAFGLSLYTYVIHDRKIKEQDKLINQFTLEKFEKEAELDKKAVVEAKITRGVKNKRTIKIYNRGRAIAKNVVVKFPGNPSLNIRDYISPIDINPQSSMDIYVSVHFGSPSTLQVDYEWEDGVKVDNRGSQVIQL